MVYPEKEPAQKPGPDLTLLYPSAGDTIEANTMFYGIAMDTSTLELRIQLLLDNNVVDTDLLVNPSIPNKFINILDTKRYDLSGNIAVTVKAINNSGVYKDTVCYLYAGKREIYKYDNPLISPNDITKSDDGQIWFITSKALYTILNGEVKGYTFESYEYIYALTVDKYGTPWVLDEYGWVYKFDGEFNRIFRLTPYSTRNLLIDKENKFWTFTNLELFHGDNAGVNKYVYHDLPEDKYFRLIEKDNEGSIYVYCEKQIYKYENNNWVLIKSLDQAVTDLFFDRNNDLWASLYGEGIMYKDTLIEAELKINDIDEDTYGNIWIAADNSLIKYDRKSFHTYDKDYFFNTIGADLIARKVVCNNEGRIFPVLSTTQSIGALYKLEHLK